MRTIWSEYHRLYLPIGGWTPSKKRAKLKLADYIKDVSPSRGLPTPPNSVNYATVQASDALDRTYLNTRYACCVVAALAHLRGVTSANSTGAPIVYTDSEILTMYRGMSGNVFDPEDSSTDCGCDESVALQYTMDVGYTDGLKNTAVLAIDASSETERRLGLWLFEGFMSGQSLPAGWLTPMPRPGFVFDVAGPPVDGNGHAMAHVGYDSLDNYDTRTWGFGGRETGQAMAKYAVRNGGGELYAVLSPEVIVRATGKAPSGFDFDTLRSDMAILSALPIADESCKPPSPADRWKNGIENLVTDLRHFV